MVGLVAGALGAEEPAPDSTVESDLYYAISQPFEENRKWEIRVATGYDFSDPYLNVFSVGPAGSLFLSDTVAIGLAANFYKTSERQAAETLRNQLSPFGYETIVLKPEYSTALTFRLVPLSGLVNLFSQQVMSAEVALQLHGGMMQYSEVGRGPLAGTGIEFALGVSPSFGLVSQMLWEFEKPPGHEWKSRAGFRIGPMWRF